MASSKTIGGVIIVISLLFTVFQVYTATTGLMTAILQRGIHLSFVLALVFLFFPAISGTKRTLFIDVPLICAAVCSGVYLYMSFDDLIYRIGDPNLPDMIVGCVTVVVLLEATRRTVGWVMTMLAVISLLYSYFGHFLPEPFGHSGRDLERIVTQMFFSTEGWVLLRPTCSCLFCSDPSWKRAAWGRCSSIWPTHLPVSTREGRQRSASSRLPVWAWCPVVPFQMQRLPALSPFP